MRPEREDLRGRDRDELMAAIERPSSSVSRSDDSVQSHRTVSKEATCGKRSTNGVLHAP